MKKFVVTFIQIFFACSGFSQSWKELAQRPSTLDLEQGSIVLQTPSFQLRLVKASQTVAALHPKADTAFDFTPGDRLKVRSSNGMYHLGDLNLRLREEPAGEWLSFSTAKERKPVEALPVKGPVLAAADLANTLPSDIPLNIKRQTV